MDREKRRGDEDEDDQVEVERISTKRILVDVEEEEDDALPSLGLSNPPPPKPSLRMMKKSLRTSWMRTNSMKRKKPQKRRQIAFRNTIPIINRINTRPR
jgi:hypothetical protein